MNTETQDIDIVLLKTSDVARMLKVAQQQVVKLASSGAIPFLNVGVGKYKSYRFRKEDVEQFIDQRTNPAQAVKYCPRHKS